MKDARFIDYLVVFVWLILIPILGIVGYLYDISWLFYICGAVMLLTNAAFLFLGALRCFGVVLLAISCIVGYYITNTLGMGMLLGPCITSTILGVGIIFLICLSGISTIKGLFDNNVE